MPRRRDKSKRGGGRGGGGKHTRGAINLNHEMAVAAHEVNVTTMGV